MKGLWTVTTARIDGDRKFRAVRKLDRDRDDSEDNREYAGTWCTSRKATEALAKYLNDKEAEA